MKTLHPAYIDTVIFNLGTDLQPTDRDIFISDVIGIDPLEQPLSCNQNNKDYQKQNPEKQEDTQPYFLCFSYHSQSSRVNKRITERHCQLLSPLISFLSAGFSYRFPFMKLFTLSIISLSTPSTSAIIRAARGGILLVSTDSS